MILLDANNPKQVAGASVIEADLGEPDWQRSRRVSVPSAIARARGLGCAFAVRTRRFCSATVQVFGLDGRSSTIVAQDTHNCRGFGAPYY